MKKLFSYLIPTRAETPSATMLPGIEVNFNNGKVHIDGKNVNYSFGSLHQVFRKAIKLKKKEISEANSTLILGFGAGSIAKILWNEKDYKTAITGVDFESIMFDLARKYGEISHFELLNLKVINAKDYIKNCQDHYDVIFIDLFIESEIPAFCLSEKFLSNIKKCLSENGLVVWNTLITNQVTERIAELASASKFSNNETQTVSKDNVVVFLNK